VTGPEVKPQYCHTHTKKRHPTQTLMVKVVGILDPAASLEIAPSLSLGRQVGFHVCLVSLGSLSWVDIGPSQAAPGCGLMDDRWPRPSSGSLSVESKPCNPHGSCSPAADQTPAFCLCLSVTYHSHGDWLWSKISVSQCNAQKR
jgi:hypothetical protein